MSKPGSAHFFSIIAIALAVGFLLGAFSTYSGSTGMAINYDPEYRALTLANKAPVASFKFTPASPAAGQAIVFDASASYDIDGAISSYSWSFGDGTKSSGITAKKAFSKAGTYSVTLTVKDNQGKSATATKSVVVASANKAPTASFAFTPASPVAGQQVTFDGSASSDSDGSIAAYSWVFSDKTTATGKVVYKTFAAAGTFKANLTVTDNKGAKSATVTKTITVTAPTTTTPNTSNTSTASGSGTTTTTTANILPVARFTYLPSYITEGYLVVFDASTSADADGTISSYQWNFGDRTTGTGKVVYHNFDLDGGFTASFIVGLTVTDNKGGKAAVNKTVTVYQAY